MAEYIDRDYLLFCLREEMPELGESPDLDRLYNIVLKAPAENVTPVRHGHYLKIGETDGEWSTYMCSSCGAKSETLSGKPLDNYCCCCGAKMDLKNALKERQIRWRKNSK